MRKVGIITFHRAINYGAMLQAVALQRAITELGYPAELIDYVDRLYERYKTTYRSSGVVQSAMRYALSGKKLAKKRKFERFLEENAIISKRRYDSDSVHRAGEEYGTYITGSDQVFNPLITERDSNYLLAFVKDKTKCNSYAASIGLNSLTTEDAQWLKAHVSGFNRVFVREEMARRILTAIGIANVDVVADPTLLLSVDEWKKMEKSVRLPKRYILSYGFHRNESMERAITEQARRTGLPVCEVSDSVRRYKAGRLQIGGVGPAEWLFLVHNADYVFTNSYHGMIFGFLFGRQVWVCDPGDGTFSRMTDFLMRIGCENRILDIGGLDILWEDQVDFSKIQSVLTEMGTHSKQLLLEMLRRYD